MADTQAIQDHTLARTFNLIVTSVTYHLRASCCVILSYRKIKRPRCVFYSSYERIRAFMYRREHEVSSSVFFREYRYHAIYKMFGIPVGEDVRDNIILVAYNYHRGRTRVTLTNSTLD